MPNNSNLKDCRFQTATALMMNFVILQNETFARLFSLVTLGQEEGNTTLYGFSI